MHLRRPLSREEGRRCPQRPPLNSRRASVSCGSQNAYMPCVLMQAPLASVQVGTSLTLTGAHKILAESSVFRGSQGRPYSVHGLRRCQRNPFIYSLDFIVSSRRLPGW